MALRPRELQERVSRYLVESLGAKGWHESRFAYDAFPGGQDGRARLHLGFAVGLLETRPAADAPTDRHRAATGQAVHTTIGIKWAHKLTGDGQVQDYRAALDAEVDIVGAIFNTGRDPAMLLTWLGIEPRKATGDGTLFLGEVRWRALHRYPLIQG